MLSLILLSLGFSAIGSATSIWVSSYAGTVSTLSLTQTNSTYQLSNSSISYDCLSNPSWLTFNSSTRTLYCMGENLSGGNGALTTFTAAANGSLVKGTQSQTITGSVNAVQYGIPSGKTFLAIAHYGNATGGGALSAWALPSATAPILQQSIYFSLSQPGANPSRQAGPHPHQAITDPSGKFVLSPDLGADRVRVYSINATTGNLQKCPSLRVTPGSGPRHVAFSTPSSNVMEKRAIEGTHTQTYMNTSGPATSAPVAMYLVSELYNTLTGFNVTYPARGCLKFKEIEIENSFGNRTVPTGAAVAEVHLAGDSIIISNRNDSSFPAVTPNANASDSLATFAITGANKFTFQNLTPAGGSFPRSFTLNKAGDLVAVGLQTSSSVVILERNVTSGVIGEQVAEIGVDGEVTCVLWDE